MALPSLSIVIPNYNHGRHLPACIGSVMSQSVPATEVIVVDDGSTDNSLEILEELSRKYPTLRVYKNEKNSGIYPTVNRAIDLCTCECFLPLSADDMVMPGLFEKALSLLARYPQAGLCAAICEFEDLGRNLKYYLGLDVADEPRYFSPEELVAKSRQKPLLIFASPMIVRRKLMLETAGKFYPDLKWCSDWFSSWVTGYKHGICFVPEVLGRFRKYSTSYSGKGMQNIRERYEVYGAVLHRLSMPQYAESAERIVRAAALAPFGKECLKLVVTQRKYWRFLTPLYVGRCLSLTFKMAVKQMLPDSVTRWLMKVTGYASAPKSKASNSPSQPLPTSS